MERKDSTEPRVIKSCKLRPLAAPPPELRLPRTESAEPNDRNAKADKLSPKWLFSPATDRLLPNRTFARRDNVLPISATFRVERLLPKMRRPKTDMELPSLVLARTEMELLKLKPAFKEKVCANFIQPFTDKVDPTRMKLRIDKELDKVA
jgi:hypothetical protein